MPSPAAPWLMSRSYAARRRPPPPGSFAPRPSPSRDFLSGAMVKVSPSGEKVGARSGGRVAGVVAEEPGLAQRQQADGDDAGDAAPHGRPALADPLGHRAAEQLAHPRAAGHHHDEHA